MPIEYIIYIPIVVLVAIILLSKARNKAFFGLFLFWLFGSPILLNPNYVISLNFFGIDIQPNRFLFLILTPLLCLWILTPRRSLTPSSSIKPGGLKLYEIFLIGYILIIGFALVLNIGSIGLTRTIVEMTNVITFIVVYFCSKTFIKNDDFVLFQIAILFFALISAIVAGYQFFLNPEFFRLGAVRGAFSGYYRSNGLFTSEYDQGMFLVFSIITAMSMNLRWWIKIFFIITICAGVFLTMHRLSWVALIFTLGLIWLLYLRKKMLTYILVPLILITLIIGALYIPWSQMAIGKFGYNLIANRILADTLSGRFDQYAFSFSMIKDYPLGVGTYDTSFYNQVAYNRGLPFVGDNVIIVHNGFLSAGVKYGILGLLLFSLFIFTSIFYFIQYSIQKGKNWYPLLMIIFVFLIFNLTNDFSFIGTQIGVVLAWLMGGYVSFINPDSFVDSDLQPTI